MTFNVAEYNSLRTELIHHDRACLTIISLLLTASTAIYGLVLNNHPDSLLIILSVIWFVGFLYIVEKRFNIKRISYYILTEIEKYEEDFYWETWSWSSRNKKITESDDKLNESDNKRTEPDDLQLSTKSPIYIEFTLLILTEISNPCWILYKIFIVNGNKIDIYSRIELTLTVVIFLISIFYSIKYIREYRKFKISKIKKVKKISQVKKKQRKKKQKN